MFPEVCSRGLVEHSRGLGHTSVYSTGLRLISTEKLEVMFLISNKILGGPHLVLPQVSPLKLPQASTALALKTSLLVSWKNGFMAEWTSAAFSRHRRLSKDQGGKAWLGEAFTCTHGFTYPQELPEWKPSGSGAHHFVEYSTNYKEGNPHCMWKVSLSKRRDLLCDFPQHFVVFLCARIFFMPLGSNQACNSSSPV